MVEEIEKVEDDSVESFKVAKFLEEIKEIIEQDNVDYIDAIVHYCENNMVDYDVIAKFINRNALLKSIIQEEAENLNYLPKTNRLPFDELD